MRAAVRVLDSYSLIAYIEGEAGKDTVIDVFRSARDSGKSCLLSVINWCEVYYITLREAGQVRAEEVAHLISTLPIQIIEADLELAKQAAILKQALDHANADKQVRILGPATASISRLKNEYRLQIILRSQSRKQLRETLDSAIEQAPAIGGDLRHYIIEIDPLNLL